MTPRRADDAPWWPALVLLGLGVALIALGRRLGARMAEDFHPDGWGP